MKTLFSFIVVLILFGCQPKEQQDNSSVSDSVYLKDSLTNERDIVLLEKSVGNSKIRFRKAMKPLIQGEQPYSIREGREILLAELDGKIIYEFDKIDGYSSLFIDSSSLRAIELNKIPGFYLQITLYPHESLGHTWIYQFDSKFRLLDHFRSDQIEIRDSIISVKNLALSDEWGPTDQDMILSYLYRDTVFPIENLFITDSYLLKDGEMEKIKTEFPNLEFLIKMYSELNNLKKDTSYYFQEHSIKELQDNIMTLIDKKK
jgi:hypothetical protein